VVSRQEEFRDPLFQRRRIKSYHIEHQAPVDREIGVHGDVAEADDFFPGDVRVPVPGVRGQPGGRYADDRQLLRYRALEQFAVQETRFVDVAGKALHRLDGGEIKPFTPHK